MSTRNHSAWNSRGRRHPRRFDQTGRFRRRRWIVGCDLRSQIDGYPTVAPAAAGAVDFERIITNPYARLRLCARFRTATGQTVAKLSEEKLEALKNAFIQD